jgi:tetratricopeptide (TPR) repeat protein
MATEINNLDASILSSDSSLEQAFLEGLNQFNLGNFTQAASQFELVQTKAIEQEAISLKSTAGVYLAAIKNRNENKSDLSKETPEMLAQLLINKQSSIEAVEILDRAINEFPQRAVFYYLKSIAYAQLTNEQESADALTKAIELNHDFLFQYRLETDFDSVRNSEPFSFFNNLD